VHGARRSLAGSVSGRRSTPVTRRTSVIESFREAHLFACAAVGHPFPQDRMALAEKRFASALGKGDDFSAWFGIALAQATARGGLLRSPDDVRALGGLLGYVPAYSVRPSELSSVLARLRKFGVDEQVIEQLQRTATVRPQHQNDQP
jgi:hypothetical protein